MSKLFELIRRLVESHRERAFIKRTKELEKIFKEQMRAGKFNCARATADMLTEPRRTEKLQEVLAYQVENCLFSDAKATANKLNRDLTVEECLRMQAIGLSDAVLDSFRP